MPLRPGSRGLIVLLGTLAAAGPLGTDLYLPALPELGRVFASDPGGVQLTLSGYMLGMAFGQLFYGPLSDRFGRRPVLLAGLAFFALASAGCAFAPSIEALTGLRILQGLSAAAPAALSRAVVRDLYTGDAAARVLAYMAAIMGVTPVIAPLLGGEILIAFGWEATFLAIAGAVVAAGLVVAVALPETNTRLTASIRPLAVLGSYRQIARERVFLAYVACGATSFAGLFAYISGSSFVLQDGYGLSPRAFAFAFAAMVVGYIAGTLGGARVVGRLGIERTLGIGVAIVAASGATMAILAAAGLADPGLQTPATLIVPQVVYALGLGLVLPQVHAGALSPFPHIAGTASAVIGFMQMSCGAIAGVVAGQLADMGPAPLGFLIGGFAGASALAYWRFILPRLREKNAEEGTDVEAPTAPARTRP